jgi:hypothetical protein
LFIVKGLLILFRFIENYQFNYKSLVIPFSKNYSALALADKLPVAQVSMTIIHYEIWKMVLETFSWVSFNLPITFQKGIRLCICCIKLFSG